MKVKSKKVVAKDGAKPAQKPAPESKPAAPKTPEAPKAPAAPKAEKKVTGDMSKFKGVTTGMRVMTYQDYTFSQQAKNMLTDEELAANWRKEFPKAVAYTPFHVAGARRDFNAGTHSSDYTRPAKPVDRVVLVNGKRVWEADVTETEAAPAAPAVPKAEKPKKAAASKAA